jgi:hypothetical protein
MSNTDNQSEPELIQPISQIYSDQSPPTLTEQIRILTEDLESSEVTNYKLKQSIEIYSRLITRKKETTLISSSLTNTSETSNDRNIRSTH